MTKKERERLGLRGPGILVKVYRRCKGRTVRICRGLSGKVVFRGDRINPAIVFLKYADIRRFLENLREKDV